MFKKQLLKTVFKTLSNVDELQQSIKSSNAKLMTVEFIKANGEYRKMLCKVGVAKYLSKKPNKRKSKRNDEVIRVFDMESKTYKSFRLDSVVKYNCGSVNFKSVV